VPKPLHGLLDWLERPILEKRWLGHTLDLISKISTAIKGAKEQTDAADLLELASINSDCEHTGRKRCLFRPLSYLISQEEMRDHVGTMI